MKKSVFFLSLYFALSGVILAQTNSWIWSSNAGTQANEEGTAVMFEDGTNGTISAGLFSGSEIVFPTGMYSNSSPGFKDFYVVNYDQSGNIDWIKFGHGNKDEYITGICPAANGYFFISGVYTSDTLVMGNNTLIKPNGNNSDIFLAKLNSNGNVQWLKGFGGSNYEVTLKMESDFNGGVILSGNYYGNGFTLGSTSLDYSGGNETFISRFDGLGNPIWAISLNGTQNEKITDFVVDPTQGISFCGNFNSNYASFNNYSLYNTALDSTSDLIYGNIDLQGNINWVKNLLGTGNDENACIQIDPMGLCYLAVFSTSDMIEFENSQITLDAGNPCVLLCQFNQSNSVIWSQVITCSGIIDISGLEFNPQSSSLILLLNYGTLNSQTSTLTASSQQFTSQGYTDMFLSGWDNNGILLSGESIGGMFNEKWRSVSYCPQTGWIHTTGYFESPILQLGNYTMQNSGIHDAFSAVYGDISTSTSELNFQSQDLTIFPNPSQGWVMISEWTEGTNIEVFDCTGKALLITNHAGNFNIPQKGIYIVRISSSERTIVKKLVIN
jgi:hypothetical protein